MDIRALIEEMKKAQGEPARAAVDEKIVQQLAHLSDTEKEAVRDEFRAALDEKLEEASAQLKEIDLAIELAEVSKYVSLAAVAKAYFGKSRMWLYQRIKGYNINGKPAQLTDAQRKELSRALRDISQNIYQVSLRIS